MESNSEVLSGLVLERIRDGRCRYDPKVKQELVLRCLRPGVSVAATAMQHGVNTNLLRKWIKHWQMHNAVALQKAVPEMPMTNAASFLAVQVQREAPGRRAKVTTHIAQPDNSSGHSMQLHVQLPNGVAADLGHLGSTTRTSPRLSNTIPPWVNHISDLPTEFFI